MDLYSVFRVEPMQRLSLGLSIAVKERLWNLLCDSSRLTSTIVFAKKTPTELLSAVLCKVMRDSNNFICRASVNFPGPSIRVKPANKIISSGFSELFTDTKVIRMFQASDFDALNKLSPFSSVIVGKICGFHKNALTTSLLTQYLDLANLNETFPNARMMCGRADVPYKVIKQCEDTAVDCFQSYHASYLRTPKFHALDHVVDNLK